MNRTFGFENFQTPMASILAIAMGSSGKKRFFFVILSFSGEQEHREPLQ
jgi:hypothetical protein